MKSQNRREDLGRFPRAQFRKPMECIYIFFCFVACFLLVVPQPQSQRLGRHTRITGRFAHMQTCFPQVACGRIDQHFQQANRKFRNMNIPIFMYGLGFASGSKINASLKIASLYVGASNNKKHTSTCMRTVGIDQICKNHLKTGSILSLKYLKSDVLNSMSS